MLVAVGLVAACAMAPPIVSGPLGTPAPTPSPPSPSGSPVDPEAVTRLCRAATFAEPVDLACSEAAEAALEVAGRRGVVSSVEIGWNFLCPADPCPTPTPTAVQAIIRYLGLEPIGVVVRDSGGQLSAESPVPIDPSALGTPPPFVAPPDALAPLANAPPALLAREALPYCGRETAGLGGPFNATARACFLSAVLNTQRAEFLSLRSDVEGMPFTELWRFEGKGPVLVYTSGPDGWSKHSCALNLVDDHARQFDHTECSESPVR
jgi:hypothetical protein